MKTLLPMILCGALLPALLAQAEQAGVSMASCEKIAKMLDKDFREHPVNDLASMVEVFESVCLQAHGCPDFEKIRNMEVAIQSEVGSSDPGLYERLIYDVKYACRR